MSKEAEAWFRGQLAQLAASNMRKAPVQSAPVQQPIGYWPEEREGEYHSRDSVTVYRTPKAGWIPVYTSPQPAQQEPAAPSAYESLTHDMTTIAARQVPRGVPVAEFAMHALADAELREHDAAPQPAPVQQEPDAIVTSLTVGPDNIVRAGLDRELPLMTGVYASPQPKNIRVYGWVWKDKHWVDDCYTPSYTPAQHVTRGELFALVDPADLHEPLQNTKWF